MCTVIFIPGKNQQHFASLRDENTDRPLAFAPDLHTEGKITFLAPKDAKAGGTWVGVNEMGCVIILLNGGFEKHIVSGPYQKSRGLIVSELLISESPVVQWNAMQLKEIEPFTLVIWYKENLFQLVWTGEEKKQIQLNEQIQHIWSSSTLYDSGVKENRKKLFERWIENNHAISMETLMSFFLSEADAENGFIINRDEKIKTQSFSFIAVNEAEYGKMQYYDFKSNKVTGKEIKFIKKELPASVAESI